MTIQGERIEYERMFTLYIKNTREHFGRNSTCLDRLLLDYELSLFRLARHA